MLFSGATLDDILGDVIRRLLRNGERILPGKGPAREFTGVLVKLSDPRARFSRTEGRGTLFSFLGETLWYLAGSDSLEYIEYYIPKYRMYIAASAQAVRAPGAYGPRLFGGGEKSQMANLMSILRKKRDRSDTRQAVAQIFDKSDLQPDNGDVPCTTTIQFLPRGGKLHLAVTMRSNDVYRGLPGDVFAFTFIQELVARTLGLELGTYSHFVGSLHLYDDDQSSARNYLNEGFQMPIGMPAMPEGDPWQSVAWLIQMEEAIRCRHQAPCANDIDPYWQDLAHLLRIKACYETRDMRQLVQLKNGVQSPAYNAFVRGRHVALQRAIEAQPILPGMLATTQTMRSK